MTTPEIVLVAESEYRKGEEVFSAAKGVQVEPAPADETALTAAVRARRCRAVIVGVHPYRKELCEALAEAALANVLHFLAGRYDALTLVSAPA